MEVSTKLLQANELLLPQTPLEFAEKLINWGDTHESATLLFDEDSLKFMRNWSLSYYDDYCLTVVLRECVVIGSRIPIDGKVYVALDELLQTYPEHRVLYNRRSGNPSIEEGIYFTQLEE